MTSLDDESSLRELFPTNSEEKERTSIDSPDENAKIETLIENHTHVLEKTPRNPTNGDEPENANSCNQNEATGYNKSVGEYLPSAENTLHDHISSHGMKNSLSKENSLTNKLVFLANPNCSDSSIETFKSIKSGNISIRCENVDKSNENVCVNSQIGEVDLQDEESFNRKEKTSESERRTQIQAEQTSSHENNCENDLDPSVTGVDNGVQSCINNIESIEMASPSSKSNEDVSNQTESSSVLGDSSKTQKSNSNICDENESSDCQSDVEKKSIYLSFSEESDTEPLIEKFSQISPCKTTALISPSKVKRSPSSWFPQIQNVTSCSQTRINTLPTFPTFIKEEILIDETDGADSSRHLRHRTLKSKSEIEHSKLDIDKEIKLLDIRVNLTKVDCTKYLSNEDRHVSPNFSESNLRPRSKQRNDVRRAKRNNAVVKLPKCKLLLQRYIEDTKQSKTKPSHSKSTVEKRRISKNSQNRKSRRLLGETPIFNDLEFSVSKKKTSSKSQRYISSKNKAKQNRFANEQTKSDGIVSSTKKMKNSIGQQHSKFTSTNTVTMEYSSNNRRNRSVIRNESNEPAVPKTASKEQRTKNNVSISMDKYKHVVTVWYECLCCDQKYDQLHHIKQHVRGHFPNCLTS